ncbi:MAG: hypothetical protein IT172_04015 [Acidobacteria bacterium]|nr:hypothetical protein [Acidobacteriota bacterium]
MSDSTGMSRTAGRIGSVLCTLGVICFFSGLFFLPKSFVLYGVVIMAASLVGFYIEEYIDRTSASHT